MPVWRRRPERGAPTVLDARPRCCRARHGRVPWSPARCCASPAAGARRPTRPAGVLETAEQASASPTRPPRTRSPSRSRDTTRRRRRETVLFNMLSGFLGGFALMRPLDAGDPRRLVAVRQRPARRPPHPPLRPRDPDRVRQPAPPACVTRPSGSRDARLPVRRRGRDDLRRGGAAARARGRLLDAARACSASRSASGCRRCSARRSSPCGCFAAASGDRPRRRADPRARVRPAADSGSRLSRGSPGCRLTADRTRRDQPRGTR